VNYLDTGILVRALLQTNPRHPECLRHVGENALSSCHSLAETFNTLTGFFQVPNGLASEMVGSLEAQMRFEVISKSDYLTVIEEARQRGIQGGIVYDAVHAQIARRFRAERIITYNLTNFRHVAPDMVITAP